jgi:hypothetical protein
MAQVGDRAERARGTSPAAVIAAVPDLGLAFAFLIT